MQLGVQLYTLRDLDEALPETIRRVAELGYDGVQFAGFGDASPASIRDALDDTGLEVAGAHVGIGDIEDRTDEIIADHEAVGCSGLVVPSYERAAFETAAGAREAGERIAAAGDRLAEDDCSIHYHNHTFEFTPANGHTAFDVFADAAPGVGIEVDTGLANHAGVDPVALLDRYADRVEFVHLTDSDPSRDDVDTRHMDLGAGAIDLQACVDVARAGGAEWLLFEHGLTDDPVASSKGAIETMRSLV